MLRSTWFSADEVETIVRDYREAGLAPDEVAMMSFAQKVVLHAYRVTVEDIDELRSFGLTDPDILDIVLAATSRSFFSKTLDALGARPDPVYASLEPSLVDALAVGRPFDGAD